MRTSIIRPIRYSPACSGGSSVNTSSARSSFVTSLKVLRESELARLQTQLLGGASALSIVSEVTRLFQSALVATLKHVAFPPEACVVIYGSLIINSFLAINHYLRHL